LMLVALERVRPHLPNLGVLVLADLTERHPST
jgi:hypothetical protein